MAIVEELGISLKDFLPKNGGHLMNLPPGHSVVISSRLHDQLRDYAARNGISISVALEHLRDEIHQES